MKIIMDFKRRVFLISAILSFLLFLIYTMTYNFCYEYYSVCLVTDTSVMATSSDTPLGSCNSCLKSNLCGNFLCCCCVKGDGGVGSDVHNNGFRVSNEEEPPGHLRTFEGSDSSLRSLNEKCNHLEVGCTLEEKITRHENGGCGLQEKITRHDNVGCTLQEKITRHENVGCGLQEKITRHDNVGCGLQEKITRHDNVGCGLQEKITRHNNVGCGLQEKITRHENVGCGLQECSPDDELSKTHSRPLSPKNELSGVTPYNTANRGICKNNDMSGLSTNQTPSYNSIFLKSTTNEDSNQTVSHQTTPELKIEVDNIEIVPSDVNLNSLTLKGKSMDKGKAISEVSLAEKAQRDSLAMTGDIGLRILASKACTNKGGVCDTPIDTESDSDTISSHSNSNTASQPVNDEIQANITARCAITSPSKSVNGLDPPFSDGQSTTTQKNKKLRPIASVSPNRHAITQPDNPKKILSIQESLEYLLMNLAMDRREKEDVLKDIVKSAYHQNILKINKFETNLMKLLRDVSYGEYSDQSGFSLGGEDEFNRDYNSSVIRTFINLEKAQNGVGVSSLETSEDEMSQRTPNGSEINLNGGGMCQTNLNNIEIDLNGTQVKQTYLSLNTNSEKKSKDRTKDSKCGSYPLNTPDNEEMKGPNRSTDPLKRAFFLIEKIMELERRSDMATGILCALFDQDTLKLCSISPSDIDSQSGLGMPFLIKQSSPEFTNDNERANTSAEITTKSSGTKEIYSPTFLESELLVKDQGFFSDNKSLQEDSKCKHKNRHGTGCLDFKCGADDPEARCDSRCGADDPEARYDSRCGADDPEARYDSRCGADDPEARYDSRCGADDPQAKYDSRCGADDPEARYDSRCGADDPEAKHGTSNPLKTADLSSSDPQDISIYHIEGIPILSEIQKQLLTSKTYKKAKRSIMHPEISKDDSEYLINFITEISKSRVSNLIQETFEDIGMANDFQSTITLNDFCFNLGEISSELGTGGYIEFDEISFGILCLRVFALYSHVFGYLKGLYLYPENDCHEMFLTNDGNSHSKIVGSTVASARLDMSEDRDASDQLDRSDDRDASARLDRSEDRDASDQLDGSNTYFDTRSVNNNLKNGYLLNVPKDSNDQCLEDFEGDLRNNNDQCLNDFILEEDYEKFDILEGLENTRNNTTEYPKLRNSHLSDSPVTATNYILPENRECTYPLDSPVTATNYILPENQETSSRKHIKKSSKHKRINHKPLYIPSNPADLSEQIQRVITKQPNCYKNDLRKKVLINNLYKSYQKLIEISFGTNKSTGSAPSDEITRKSDGDSLSTPYTELKHNRKLGRETSGRGFSTIKTNDISSMEKRIVSIALDLYALYFSLNSENNGMDRCTATDTLQSRETGFVIDDYEYERQISYDREDILNEDGDIQCDRENISYHTKDIPCDLNDFSNDADEFLYEGFNDIDNQINHSGFGRCGFDLMPFYFEDWEDLEYQKQQVSNNLGLERAAENIRDMFLAGKYNTSKINTHRKSDDRQKRLNHNNGHKYIPTGDIRHVNRELISTGDIGHVNRELISTGDIRHVNRELIFDSDVGHVNRELISDSDIGHVNRKLISNSDIGHVYISKNDLEHPDVPTDDVRQISDKVAKCDSTISNSTDDKASKRGLPISNEINNRKTDNHIKEIIKNMRKIYPSERTQENRISNCTQDLLKQPNIACGEYHIVGDDIIFFEKTSRGENNKTTEI